MSGNMRFILGMGIISLIIVIIIFGLFFIDRKWKER